MKVKNPLERIPLKPYAGGYEFTLPFTTNYGITIHGYLTNLPSMLKIEKDDIEIRSIELVLQRNKIIYEGPFRIDNNNPLSWYYILIPIVQFKLEK